MFATVDIRLRRIFVPARVVLPRPGHSPVAGAKFVALAAVRRLYRLEMKNVADSVVPSVAVSVTGDPPNTVVVLICGHAAMYPFAGRTYSVMLCVSPAAFATVAVPQLAVAGTQVTVKLLPELATVIFCHTGNGFPVEK